MIVTYTPEDADHKKWTFDPKRVRQSEAELIEKRYGGNWDAWLQAVQSGNAKARKVLLWHLIRSEGHFAYRYEDVPDFYVGELEVEHTKAELQEIRDRIDKAQGLDEDTRLQMIGALDVQMMDAPDGDPGKAPLRHSESDTD